MIILTGASGGIGQSLYPMFEEDVVAICNRTAIHHGYKLDITNREEVAAFVAKNNLSKITLIHLAAVKIDELSAFVDEGNWDKVFNVNVKAAFFFTKALLPVMMKEKWGRIIWVISSGLGDIGTLTYSASKYALIGMNEVMSKEYARYGITSNILQLGYFDTGMYRQLPEIKQKELLKDIPSKKLGEVSNIHNVVNMIIKSPFVNGGIINVDGGV